MELPKRIGRYEIERLLGQGGMGRVMLGRDTVLERNVAIKILRDDLALPPETQAALFARMRQEARAAAAIIHPNMVVLHDMGEEEAVGLFLVFEYIDGPTLRERIDLERPLAPAEAADLALELGGALDVAHAHGIVHRDVKPENVLFGEHGAKLTDFGIARLPDSTLTQTGAVMGTVAYSAPEALTRGEFSPASDQFSLAATLYEALAGRRAFPGDDTMAVATRITTSAPDPVRAGPDGPELPRAAAVLGRAMAREPEARYPSCTEMARALAYALDPSLDTEARTSLFPPASLLTPARRRVQNLIAGLALLSLVGIAIYDRREATSADESSASLHAVASSFAAVAEPAPRSRPTPRRPSTARPKRDDARTPDDPSEDPSRDPTRAASPGASGTDGGSLGLPIIAPLDAGAPQPERTRDGGL